MEEIMNQNLVTNLITLRKNKGIELWDIALILGVKEDLVKSWEFGEKQPDMETIEKLAAFYKVAASDLFLPNCKSIGKTKRGSAKESSWRFWVWFGTTVAGIVLMVVMFGLLALKYIEIFYPWGSRYHSFYFTAFTFKDPFFIIVFTALLLVFLWQIIAFILHLVGHFKGNTCMYLNPIVSRILQMFGAILLFVLFMSTLADVGYLETGAYVLIAFSGILMVVNILAACMLKWKTK